MANLLNECIVFKGTTGNTQQATHPDVLGGPDEEPPPRA